MSVELVYSPTAKKYPLDVYDLKPGYLYECENNAIVIRLSLSTNTRPTTDPHAIFNIENGVGRYTGSHKFRVLGSSLLEITTDKFGKIK